MKLNTSVFLGIKDEKIAKSAMANSEKGKNVFSLPNGQLLIDNAR